MKQLKTTFACFLLLFLGISMCAKAQEKVKIEPVYMFGIVLSFNDSTVYVTEIQQVRAAVEPKTKFLNGREQYAAQLKEYAQSVNIETPTCVISFNDKREKLEKRFLKIKKKYIDKQNLKLETIPGSSFTFRSVLPQTVSSQP